VTDPRPSRQDPFVGATLSGCTVERLIARGGMGAAYLARRQTDGRVVVVKLLAPQAATDAHLRARLGREAAALRRIRAHPSLVAVLGADVEGQGGVPPHLVLEFAPGQTLREVVATRGALGWERAARLGVDVARGLAVIHGHGLLHRDVKPENIVVAEDGRARLIDLGIAKDVFVTGLTAPGQLLGSAETMAPEQWTNGPQDPRTDVFGLGATLYYAVCGQPAFAGGLDEIMDAASSGDLEPPTELAPDCPAELERVLLATLDPNPRHRYARMEPLAHDLDLVARGLPAAGLPALVEASGARHTLAPGRRFLLGSAPTAHVRLEHPGVAKEHAEVRKDEAGFTVVDLRSPGGTWLERGEAAAERVTQARLLEDGDLVRAGEVRLVVSDPGGRRRPPAFLDDVERAESSEALVAALALGRDPRAVAELLERLTPDPLADRLAEAMLRSLGGPAAGALLARRAALASAARAALPALLEGASGERLGADPVAWLGWWLQARAQVGPQVGVARPPRALRLETPGVPPALLLAAAGEPGVLLLGRDARCHARLDDPRVSRLHATVVRLHRRLVVRDEGSAAGILLDGAPVHVAFLDPGSTLSLGGLTLSVAGDEVEGRAPSGQRLVDSWTFQALEEAGHPATFSAHVDLLAAAARAPAQHGAAAALLAGSRTARIAARGAALGGAIPALAVAPGGPDPAVAAQVAELWARRGQRSRTALATALGRDAGPDPAAWRALLAPRAATLGPQVAPAGWLEPA
jgi:pSer/pThr/pTyr-binding forkhead associated (FHA) protein